MSLTESGAAVEEERVVAITWWLDNATSGSVGDFIIGADNEIGEGIFAIKTVVFYEIWGFNIMISVVRGGAFNEFAGGDFARANAGFGVWLDFVINSLDVNVVFSEGVDDGLVEFDGELFDMKRVFDADSDVTVVVF